MTKKLTSQDVIDYFEKKSKELADSLKMSLLSREHQYVFIRLDEVEELLFKADMPLDKMIKAETYVNKKEKTYLNFITDILMDKLERKGLKVELVGSQTYINDETLEREITPMYWEISLISQEQKERERISKKVGEVDSLFACIFSDEELVELKARVEEKEFDRLMMIKYNDQIESFSQIIRIKLQHLKSGKNIFMLNDTLVEFLALSGLSCSCWHELNMPGILEAEAGIKVKNVLDSDGLHWVFSLEK